MEIQYAIVGDCWECVSHATDSNGYPVSKVGGKWNRIYRHFYEKYKGPISDGEVVRHSCDNRRCINPAHLNLGTHADNVRDRVERGRSAKGVNNGRAKFTETEVVIIRADLTTPKMILARTYGVDPKTIRNIQQGITWV